jgi:3-methyladenine DNA glycosylase AlkD
MVFSMKTKEARELGYRIGALVADGQMVEAADSLAPILAQRTPFRLLDLIGEKIGAGPTRQVDLFLDRIASGRTEGGWVVIASALKAQLDDNLEVTFSRCRDFIVLADVWYATDILGERVPGPALVSFFIPALEVLTPWRADANPWVRRTVGVAVHFWAKRSRSVPELAPQAGSLLQLLQPMFEEKDVNVVKGVGWGLKTLGRYYPEQTTGWLAERLAEGRKCRALMLRKALTYLPDENRARVKGQATR